MAVLGHGSHMIGFSRACLKSIDFVTFCAILCSGLSYALGFSPVLSADILLTTQETRHGKTARENQDQKKVFTLTKNIFCCGAKTLQKTMKNPKSRENQPKTLHHILPFLDSAGPVRRHLSFLGRSRPVSHFGGKREFFPNSSITPTAKYGEN